MIIPSIRTDVLPDAPYGPESDSCAIYISARKHGQSTFGTLKRSISALVQKKWTQAQKIQQLEKVTTNLLMMVNNLAKELKELKAKQNPE